METTRKQLEEVFKQLAHYSKDGDLSVIPNYLDSLANWIEDANAPHTEESNPNQPPPPPPGHK